MTHEVSRMFRGAIAFLLTSALFFALTPMAVAGCGCDHPPPDWAMVMPSFGSHGKTLTLFPDGFAFDMKQIYQVQFEDHTGATRLADGYAETPASLNVRVPDGLTPGPVSIHLPAIGKRGYTYGSELFTAMSAAPIIPTVDGVYEAASFEGAVTADGTLLVSFNLSDVLDATQFAYQFTNLPLSFGPDDVVFYNEDGIDLTLFTLSVADEVEHQWGSYYGWTVEDDTNLTGRVFGKKVRLPSNLGAMSDILNYWRHEFHTYYQAHLPSGSHEVSLGMHPDGTLHIDHDHLVLAISGKVRSAQNPTNMKKAKPPASGHLVFDLALAVQGAENPVEPELMIELLDTAPRQPLVPETALVYDVRKLDGSLLAGETDRVLTTETKSLSIAEPM